MSAVGQQSMYMAYLLRCWLDGTNWRYSLEEVGTSKRRGFATLDELVSFLVAISTPPNEGEISSGVKVDPQTAKSEVSSSAKSPSSDER